MQHKYFAASNSAHGFVSYFGEIFKRADFIYIIKGGPGTGKSSLMRKIAHQAECRGEMVEYYYCSSDPESLDGVLIFIANRAIGIVDGTSPHTREPEMAGIYDEIINLAAFWDRELLLTQKNEIISLSRKKSASYRRAYDYLRSCGNLQAVIDALLEPAIDRHKMTSAAERLVASLGLKGGRADIIPVSLSAIGMTGVARLDSFENNAKRLYYVGDFYGVGKYFLTCLFEALSGQEIKLRVSYDAVCSWLVDGIFIDELNIAFLLHNDDALTDNSEKQINSKRFVNQDNLRAVRSEIRYAKKLYDGALDGAIHALGEVKIYHFLLEDIYKNAMDFEKMSLFVKNFKI